MSTGCRDDNNNFTPADLSASTGMDMSTTGNMDLAGKVYMDAKIHDIDTGTVTSNPSVAVKVSGAIATTIVTFFKSNHKMTCTYEVFLQDPTCTTPPCGIVAEVDGPAVSGGTCPKANMSGTPLASVNQGDQVDVSGMTDAFSTAAPGDAGVMGTTVQHSLKVEAATVTATKQTLPTPVAISTADQAKFVPYDPNGLWQTNEGMLVKLSDVTVASTDSFGNFTTCPGAATSCASPASWGGTFDFLYRFQFSDAGVFPTVGTHFASITGVVNSLFGGTILPTGKNDFQP